MESKTILIVAPSLQGGGIERVLTNLSSHFVKRGHKVIYVACRAGNHFYQLDDNVIFREPTFVHTASAKFKVINYIKTIKFIRKQIKEFKPDTILSFGDIINPLALIANFGLKYPVFISDRISPKQKLGFSKVFLKRITYPFATGIIAQSSIAAEYKKQVFGNKINITIIPNALREVAPCADFNAKKKWVVGVGRLSFEKGFDRLIEAFAKIEGHKDWQLVLAGDGPARKDLENQVESLGVKNRVVFRGMIKDVDSFLAQGSIFVLPSRCEGFPNALCEAMASPLPCISFDSVSASDIIENRVSGVVIPDGDIDALASEIQILMDDEQTRCRYSEKAFLIREKLDKDKIGDRFLEYILNC